MVTPGNSVADIGCDHAHTGIYLLQAGISPKAIAMDLRKGPLAKAEENVREQGLEDRIEVRLSDGLEKLCPGEADTILISGMGGPLITRILERKPEVAKSAKELVLSPQSDLPEFKTRLSDNGFVIADTKITEEDDKFYFVFRVLPESETVKWSSGVTPKEIYEKYLLRELKTQKSILQKLASDDGEKAASRREEIYNEIRRTENEINRMRN